MPRRADQPHLPHYLAITPRKLAILCVSTFGLYEIYWFYRQWKVYSLRTGKKVWPFWRALFSPLTSYPLFAEVAASSGQRAAAVSYPVVGLSTLYLLFSLFSALPDPFWLITVASVVPMLYVQEAMNREPGVEPSNKLTTGQTVLATLGFSVFVLVILVIAFDEYAR